jgi:hypothetical protein
MRVAPSGGDAQNLELGTLQRESSPKASSMSVPISVSMMIFSVVLGRDAELSVCADMVELNRKQSANTPATKRTLRKSRRIIGVIF